MSRATVLRRNATSLALIAVAVGLGAYAYFVDRGKVTDTERARRSNDVFPAYRREDVSRVLVARAGAPALVLERKAGPDGGDPSWTLASPRPGEEPIVADQAAVERLLGAFEFASIVRKVAADAGAFAAAPRATGTLGMGRVVYHFVLGAAAPAPEGSAYFHVDGEGDFVIPHELVTALLQSPDTYRERTIVPYLSLDLSRLEVSSPPQKSSVVLDRIDGTSFRLPALGLRASRETLDRIWSALGEMRAESFLDDAAADRAIESPSFVIHMVPTDKSKPAGDLVVGGPCPDHPEDVVVVRKSPSRVSACAPKGILAGLGTTDGTLVDRRLFSAHGDEIEELRFEGLAGDPRRVEIARTGNGWHERLPADRTLAGDEVDAANALADLLARAEAVPGDGAPAVKPGDPGAPFAGRARVTVTKLDHGGDETVTLGPVDGQVASVHRGADGAILRVPLEVARKLLPSPIAIRARDLFPPLSDTRAPVRVATSCDGVAQELVNDTTGWSMHELVARGGSGEVKAGTAFPADVAGALDLASAVGRAKAESWAADADDGTFGLGPSDPRCTLSVDYADDAGKRSTVLEFGATSREGEGGTYARVAGDPAVFVAPRSLRALAAHWLIDRAGFRASPAQVERVTLEARTAGGAKRAAFVRQGQELVMADGKPSDVAARVSEALASLRAEGVVHTGPARPDEGFTEPALDVRLVRAGDDAGATSVHFVVGHAGVWENERVYFARLDGVNATFAIAEGRLAPLFDAL